MAHREKDGRRLQQKRDGEDGLLGLCIENLSLLLDSRVDLHKNKACVAPFVTQTNGHVSAHNPHCDRCAGCVFDALHFLYFCYPPLTGRAVTC